MTDVLTKILSQLPRTENSLAQLSAIIKSLDGQTLNAVLTATGQKQAQNLPSQLQLQLPLSNQQSPNNANPSPQTGVNAQLNAVQSLVLNLSDIEIQKNLESLLRDIKITVEPKFSHNRVSLPMQFDLSAIKEGVAKNQLLAVLLKVAQWAEQPKPLVMVRQSTESIDKLILNATTANKLIDSSALSSSAQVPNSKASIQSAPSISGPPQSGQSQSGQVQSALSAQTDTLHSTVKNETKSSAQQTDLSTNLSQPNKLNIEFTLRERLKQTVLNDPSATKYKQRSEQPILLTTRLPLQNISSDLLTRYIALFDQNNIPSSTSAALTKVITQLLDFKNLEFVKPLLNILKNLPKATELNGATLRQAVFDSGQFFEQKAMQTLTKGWTSVLSQPTTNSQGSSDLKHLLYLVRQFSQLPSDALVRGLTASAQKGEGSSAKDLFIGVNRLVGNPRDKRERLENRIASQLKMIQQDVDSALNKVKLTQFQNLHLTDSNAWIFELPLQFQRQLTNVQMKFEASESEQSTDKKSWCVTVRFDFERLGAFHAITRLFNQRLDIKFVAEKLSTQRLLQQKMPELKQQLIDSGLLINEMTSVAGESPNLTVQQLPQSLVDYRV